MSAVHDPYRVLGLSPGADARAIRRAFRTLAREHHPDVSTAPGAEHRFREIVEAYERLAVTRRRRNDPADVSAIVSFYAWLAARPPRHARAEEPVSAPPEPPPRHTYARGGRATQLASAVGLAYALVLLVLLLAR